MYGKIYSFIKNIRRRKAVSSVIAAILLIGLTITAAAALALIVLPMLNTSTGAIQFYLELNHAYDFNNDGLADGLEVDIRNIDGSNRAGTASHISLDNWEFAPGHEETSIASRKSKTILLVTSSTSAQFNINEKVELAISNIEGEGEPFVLSIESIRVPNPVTVSVKAGEDPVEGVKVSFETEEGLPVSFPPTPTDTSGQIEAFLLPNWYRAKTETQITSELFHRTLNYSVSIQSEPVISENINVRVVDGDYNPISDIRVYDTDLEQRDLGQSYVTNTTGYATFVELEGEYLFRAHYMEEDYWSSSVVVPGSANITTTIVIGSDAIVGQILMGGEPVGNGYLLQLYSYPNNRHMGSDYTNSSSYIEFTGIPAGLYRLRLDYQNSYYWSRVISTSDPDLTVDFGGGTLQVQVLGNGDPLPSGVLTRLLKADTGRYVGRYDYLNSSGWAVFPTTPSANYSLRIDWLSNYYYSDSFYHDGTPLQIDIGGGYLDVQIMAGSDPLPSGVLVRLMRGDNGRYTGTYDYTNGTGFAEFGAIPEGNYSLRVDWLSNYYYTDSFIHDGTPQILSIGGGSMNIQITANGEVIPSGVLVRLMRGDNGRYTGTYDYTNGTGFAEFGPIPEYNYSLRLDWLGTYFYTDSFNHTGISQTVDVGGGLLIFEVRENGSPVGSGVYTQLFLDGGYCGTYDYTNGSSYAFYGAIPEGSYQLRVRIDGQYYYSEEFTHTNSTVKIVDIDTN